MSGTDHRVRRWRTALYGVAAGLLLVGVLQVAPDVSANAAGPAPHYLMTAFTNGSESNMHIYDSPNAGTFTLQRANVYTPPSGLVRDPSVMKHSDGYYYVAYTTNWTGNTIGIARSSDYLTWTFQRDITISAAPATGSTWAPEWFTDTDGSVNLIMSVSQTGTAGQFQAYKITATDATLAAWSAPAKLTGIGPNYIDSFIVKVGNTYHDFTKNETTKYIEHATATSLTGPWTFVGKGDWAGWGAGNEGGALVQLPNGNWRIYFDQYGAGHYWYADSSNLTSFSAKTELAGLSGTVRHFTVLRENVGDNSALPTGNRSLQSSNNPTRYVRHRDSLGYVEPLSSAGTLTERQDGTFRIVAGLANPACYSLESVNYPGRYLRHYDFVLTLQQNDGGPIFAGDATFCSRTGLAGGATYSLESYNHPGFYLRHYNYALRVDRYAAGGTFAGDASFAVTEPLAATTPTAADTSSFRGVNWADARDNYVDGWVIPTGLLAGDSYATVRSKADGIIAGFQSQIGANTVRLPINPQSVNSDWWARYKGTVDSALAHGFKVILSYWEANKDGRVDDTAAWNTMWDTVTTDYGGNADVYFEPMNEPFAYSLNDWVSLCSTWLSRHAAIPRGRVLISGTGYNDNVTGVGAASALSGTLLSLHFYGFWATDTTRAAWTTNLSNRLGSYSSRTIIDEAGSPMTTGLTYTGGQNQDGNVFTAYLAATTDLARARRMGIVYWPGLRAGDSYSLTSQSGSGLTVNNASGVAQLRWGWGL